MDFAMTTDYLADTGCPEEALRRIAAAGWRWVHWCHHWNDDFLYGRAELDPLAAWLKELGLGILDIHGSGGREKRWDSPRDYERQAGVELVRNRLEMADRFGCRVVIMHTASVAAEEPERTKVWDGFRRSIDAVIPDCRRLGIRLAMENLAHDNFDHLDELMAAYGPEVMGVCYDSGHGQLSGNGLARLRGLAKRLIALHLNDNDGQSDLHQPLFQGQVDWAALAGLVVASGYSRAAMSVEVVRKNSGIAAEEAFLRETLAGARRFGALVAARGSGAV